jgi:hypothetical protein
VTGTGSKKATEEDDVDAHSNAAKSLAETIRAGEERKLAVQPGFDDGGGLAGRRQKCGHDDVDVEHHTHQR